RRRPLRGRRATVRRPGAGRTPELVRAELPCHRQHRRGGRLGGGPPAEISVLMRASSEAVDIREIALALRREWRWLAGGVVVGLLLAILVLLFVRPRYQASATVLLRTQITQPGSLMSSSGGGEGEGT